MTSLTFREQIREKLNQSTTLSSGSKTTYESNLANFNKEEERSFKDCRRNF